MSDEPTAEGSRPVSLLLVLSGIAFAALLALGNSAFTTLKCGTDTSYCAKTASKNGVYSGTITSAGAPLANQSFLVTFETRRDSDDPVEFSTDSDGRFCVRWAEEVVSPFVETVPPREDLTITSGLGEESHGEPQDRSLSYWHQASNAYERDNCQDSREGIAWDRAEDASSSWQFALLIGLPIAAAVLLLAALALRRRGTGPKLAALGWAAVGASLLLTLILQA